MKNTEKRLITIHENEERRFYVQWGVQIPLSWRVVHALEAGDEEAVAMVRHEVRDAMTKEVESLFPESCAFSRKPKEEIDLEETQELLSAARVAFSKKIATFMDWIEKEFAPAMEDIAEGIAIVQEMLVDQSCARSNGSEEGGGAKE